MANLFHSRGVIGLVLLFCGCASLFLGVMGICLIQIWNNSPWISPPIWSGVTGLLAGMLGIISTRSTSLHLARSFVFSCIVAILATCSGLGVLIAQLSFVARACELTQQKTGTDCNHKLVIISGFMFAAMLLVLLASLVGVSLCGGETSKEKTIARAPEQGIVLVSTPHSDTHQTLVPVTCQYISKSSGRDSVVLVPWTIPSSTPSYNNRLSNAFNVSFNAGGTAFENRQSRYVPLD